MKLIIDIPEDRYDEIHSLKFVMYGLQSEENKQLFYRLINAVQDGTPIPDNATNGDVIKAMFPNTELHKESDYVSLTIQDGVYLEDRDGSWWFALYQKGGK